MKTIRGLMTLAGLSLMLLPLGATRTNAQVISTRIFSATFHLPYEAQWGKMTLPAGDYILQYGVQETGHHLVAVRGTAQGSPYGVVLAGPKGETPAAKNEILCVREGDTLIVRALEMPVIGESVNFAPPPGAKLEAHNSTRGGYQQLAEAPMLIQRIPIRLNAK